MNSMSGPIAKSLGRASQSSIQPDDLDSDHDTPIHEIHENPTGSGLRRGLSARQVQMIAIAGTIGTGLFLGTGRSLAQGGPASLLICYIIVGFIVYITLLLLGEMATQYPVAGSFNAYTTRFFSPSYGFALAWAYWFKDAVFVASDLTAAQLVLQFWTPWNPWVISVVFWFLLVGINALHVKGYGELEYWLSSLKITTVIIFIITGVLVNAGVNSEHRYIGGSNWRIPGAPFVGGFGGFARVFVTASFAFAGTEGLGITAGETENPSKNMPRVVKLVFWRVMICYILTTLLIGLNVPWDYPNLSNRSVTTSPFTIVFKEVGSNAAASFMNTVILTSVLSAGNHALFSGTRVLYGLSVTTPRQAPRILSWTNSYGTPIPALLATSSFSALCFTSSFIGSGQLWEWLQNIVGVTTQIAWLSIGLASWRFRKAWVKQGRPLDELKFRASWTWPWGPPFVYLNFPSCFHDFSDSMGLAVQGWSSFVPKFSVVDFVSFYIEIPIIIIMFLTWLLFGARESGRSAGSTSELDPLLSNPGVDGSSPGRLNRYQIKYHDLVDVDTVDLKRDEYEEVDAGGEDEIARRLSGKKKLLWTLYYWIV
ncbi:hypothetical protein BYT27DRAFT_7186985 [Phlegmacium glaucopus]|nr:hypothetical protein BYT27DRAFT_7186985 [Phlegmacium glaucopus]